MAKQTGTYFRDIYSNIVRQLPQFPIDDPNPNLQECIKPDYVNFVRAEILAKKHNLSSDIIKHLQEMAVLQYLVDYNNLEGLLKLSSDYNLSRSERIRLVNLVAQESAYPCFSFSKTTEIAIDDSILKGFTR